MEKVGSHANPEMLRLRLRMSCAAAAMLAVLSPWQAIAQDRDALRGEVPESAINEELLRRQEIRQTGRTDGTGTTPGQPTSAAPPAYQPASEGAVADEEDPDEERQGASIFRDTSTTPGFLDEEAAPAGRAPSTARQRAEQARDRLTPPRPTQAPRRAAATEATDEATRGDGETTGAIEPVGTVDSETDLTIDEGAERAAAIEGLDRPEVEDPYAPLGLRVGTFTLYSTFEQGLNWNSNVNYSENAESALRSETSLRFRAESDWAQHSARMEAFGTLREAIDGPNVDDNDAGFDGELQVDITDELRALGTLNYAIRPESASSPIIIEDAVSRPIRQTLEGTAGLQKDVGKLRFGITGGLLNETYGDADLANGEILSQKERDSLLATVKLRAGYEISPAVTPFAEVEVGRRKYDVEADLAGFRRSSDRLAARVGVELDMGEKLRGEIAAGWLQETPDDNRLAKISSPSVDATLRWSPERGTDVTLLGSTTVETTDAPDQSGSLLYTGRLSVDRAIRANLTGNAALGAAWRDYVGSDGHDLTLSAEVGLTWWLNRYMGITGRARHEQLESNLEGRDAKVNSVFLGVRLQR